MRVLISSIGSAGDINPFIAIGQELVRRGHETAMLVNPHFAQSVQEPGIRHLPLSDEETFLRVLHSPNLSHPIKGHFVVWEMLIAQTAQSIEAADQAIAEFKPDIVLRNHLQFGVQWVCQRHGVRCAVGVVEYNGWLSVFERATFPSPIIAALQLAIGHGVRWASRPVAYALVERHLHKVRREYGFPSQRRLIPEEWRGGVVNLGLWSPLLRGPMPDDPPQGVICGFPFFDQSHDCGDEWERVEAFLGDGDPPIVFALGTTAVHAPGSFYDCAVETCRLLQRRGVLLTGNSQPPPKDLPRNVLVVPYAPFSLLLPRACATVHHGGIGSTAQALRAGRPMVVTPFTFDQPQNAARVASLGVARVVPPRRLVPARLAAALRDLLEDDAVVQRAAEIGLGIARENGAAAAADQLELAAGANGKAR